MEKKYYLLEKNVTGGNSYTHYTLEELKKYFEPKDTDGNILNEEAYTEWKSISNIEDMEYFLENHVNNEDGMHYHDYYIEEV